ncbi:MAG: cytochrome b/b6 domain-containing protein [Thalassotalea sp.]|nr:cytochrome b/b6 domain-containing protein [Thalassotalea sp.]
MSSIRVWDTFTRIYHISQLILLALLWYSAEQADFELHFLCGFVLLSLWLTRLVWGFIGSDSSRFINFIKSPFDVLNAWRDNTISKPHIGHNPVGGYMVMALLIAIGLQVFTGLFASDDVFSEGPLYLAVSDSFASSMDSLHHLNFDILLVLVGLHALAGIFHVVRGDNVIKAIITGKKRTDKKNLKIVDAKPVQFKGVILPLILWGALCVIIYSWGMPAASY